MILLDIPVHTQHHWTNVDNLQKGGFKKMRRLEPLTTLTNDKVSSSKISPTVSHKQQVTNADCRKEAGWYRENAVNGSYASEHHSTPQQFAGVSLFLLSHQQKPPKGGFCFRLCSTSEGFKTCVDARRHRANTRSAQTHSTSTEDLASRKY